MGSNFLVSNKIQQKPSQLNSNNYPKMLVWEILGALILIYTCFEYGLWYDLILVIIESQNCLQNSSLPFV